MGLLALLRRLIFGAPIPEADGQAVDIAPSQSASPPPVQGPRTKRPLAPLRYRPAPRWTPHEHELDENCPYKFATPHVAGRFLDLSRDADQELLDRFGLPRLTTPQELADWLPLPIGRLAWLSGRFYENGRPATLHDSHYHCHWIAKRSGGHRLIEAPKQMLRLVQDKILHEILEKAPVHHRAFGFVSGRSAKMNAAEHVGKYVVLKFDLENFYASVRYSRVVAIYRAMGFSRVVAIWLARLTTCAAPSSLAFPGQNPRSILPYLSRHLPQGAPTSPALANLSAFSLDIRLSGLARSFHAQYSRYADDLTFSGSNRFAGSLRDFIPLVERIIRQERFKTNKGKRRVVRQSDRQIVTGVVVNQRMNIARDEYDRLKAILHNCLKTGPAAQNRENHPQFAAHLLGRIVYVGSLNAERGSRLRASFDAIDWSK
jgi:hypothetical protein